MEEKMIKDFIKYLVENNDYYELTKKEFEREIYQESFINAIYELYKNYNSYYSVYTILDTIEDYLKEDKDNTEYRDIYDVINSEDFEIKDYWR